MINESCSDKEKSFGNQGDSCLNSPDSYSSGNHLHKKMKISNSTDLCD